MRSSALVGVIVLTGALSCGAAQIVSIEPVPPPAQTYPEYLKAARAGYEEEIADAKRDGLELKTPFAPVTEQDFAEYRDATKIEVQRVTYLSDGLKVVGYVTKPKNIEGRRLPVIIFARGGNRDFGKFRPWTRLARFALEGFVVVAPQCRGVDGGEGREEFGGADVNDIVNLNGVLGELDYVDPENVFLFGWSRGGMMAYLALKRGMKANAIAVGGPLLDLFKEAERRPGMVDRVWKELMPDYEHRRDERLRERSAIMWGDTINTPVLLLQGGADWRVHPSTILEFAQKLQKAGREYELVVYGGDDHGVQVNKEDRDQRIVRWFRKHMK